MASPQEVLDQIDSQLFVLEDGLRVLTLAAEADGDVDPGERHQLDGMAADIAKVKDKRTRLAKEVEAAKEGGLMGLVATFRANVVAAEELDIGTAKRAASELASAVCNRDKPLSAREQVWVEEVRKDPEIDMLFTIYDRHTEVSEPVIGRVDLFCEEDGTQSKTQSGYHYDADSEDRAATGHDIEIADPAYTLREDWVDQDGKALLTTDEQEFKFTLIHEMIHHLVDQTEALPADGAVLTPGTLMKVMLENPALFGWVVTRAPDEGGTMRAVTMRLEDTTTSISWEGYPHYVGPKHPLREAVEKKSYERACDTRSPEEDLADMMALFLTCDASKETLQKRFPRRFDLCLEFYEKI